MDKENPNVRKYIAQRADLLGAIRLPNNTFKDAAGTEVTYRVHPAVLPVVHLPVYHGIAEIPHLRVGWDRPIL